jgi:hypothetical protein
MPFPCPKCNTPDKGVLLFNLVAPCDACAGIIPEKKKEKEKYTIHKHKELPSLGVYYKVALGCGGEEHRDYLNERIRDGGVTRYCFDLFSAKEYIDLYVKNKPESLCVVQWSE